MSDERELVMRLSADFGVYLAGSVPRIAEALESGQAEASFSATVQFKAKRIKGQVIGYTAVIKPRERVPLAPREYKVSVSNGQLSLFQGVPDPDPVPIEDDPEW